MAPVSFCPNPHNHVKKQAILQQNQNIARQQEKPGRQLSDVRLPDGQAINHPASVHEKTWHQKTGQTVSPKMGKISFVRPLQTGGHAKRGNQEEQRDGHKAETVDGFLDRIAVNLRDMGENHARIISEQLH